MCNLKFEKSFFVAQKSQRVKFHGSEQEVMSKVTVRGGRRLRLPAPTQTPLFETT